MGACDSKRRIRGVLPDPRDRVAPFRPARDSVPVQVVRLAVPVQAARPSRRVQTVRSVGRGNDLPSGGGRGPGLKAVFLMQVERHDRLFVDRGRAVRSLGPVVRGERLQIRILGAGPGVPHANFVDPVRADRIVDQTAQHGISVDRVPGARDHHEVLGAGAGGGVLTVRLGFSMPQVRDHQEARWIARSGPP